MAGVIKPKERAARAPLWSLLFTAMVRLLSARNLRNDRFGTLAAIAGVALGAATVNVVVILDVNTTRIEAARAAGGTEAGTSQTSPAPAAGTLRLQGVRRDGTPIASRGAKATSSEDFEVLRAGIRIGSLAAFLVGALIVFFTFGTVIERRRREVALLRSLGAVPAQVAAIFVREAGIIGGAGGGLGLLASIPMAYFAARAGVTTTGHLKIDPHELVYPWGYMALTSLVGAAMALLGVVRPVREVLHLGVVNALRPRFAEGTATLPTTRRPRAYRWLVLPILVIAYAAGRPALKGALSAVAFHALEAVALCLVFVATLVLVPDLVRRLGGLLLHLLPRGPWAERLLTQRRIQHRGHELTWSVSGVMVVFSLLLTLHIVTAGLKREVVVWAQEVLHDEVYLLPWYPELRADSLAAKIPPDELVVNCAGRTPWPNALHAVRTADLAALAAANGEPDLVALTQRLGPGKILLSTMMARRFGVSEGDAMEVSGSGGSRRLQIAAVTDRLGFTPMKAAHRNARTYGLIDAADQDLIAPYADSIGAVAVIAHASHPEVQRWRGAGAATLTKEGGIFSMPALFYKNLRLSEANSDFLIFDLLLGLTSVLAGMGIANQLVLSVRARAREIALYRVLGMTPRQVRRLVLMEGAFIGLLGGCLAVLLGVPLGYTALEALRAVSAFEVSFTLPPSYVPLTIAGAVLISTGASLLPALRAARASAAASVHQD